MRVRNVNANVKTRHFKTQRTLNKSTPKTKTANSGSWIKSGAKVTRRWLDWGAYFCLFYWSTFQFISICCWDLCVAKLSLHALSGCLVGGAHLRSIATFYLLRSLSACSVCAIVFCTTSLCALLKRSVLGQDTRITTKREKRAAPRICSCSTLQVAMWFLLAFYLHVFHGYEFFLIFRPSFDETVFSFFSLCPSSSVCSIHNSRWKASWTRRKNLCEI